MFVSQYDDDLVQATRQSLQSLNVQRQALEQEADAITSELMDESRGVQPMGVDTPLVDAEGYPRADIDIHRARSLRGRLAIIRTDHKRLMKEIEKHLQQLAALQNPNHLEQDKKEYAARLQPKPKPKYDPVSGKWVVMNWDGTIAGAPGTGTRSFDTLGVAVSTSDTSTSTTTASSAQPLIETLSAISLQPLQEPMLGSVIRPFASVNTVAEHSPAHTAGLRANDRIVAFGDVKSDSFPDPIQQVGELVPRAAAANDCVQVIVQRVGEVGLMTLQLYPQPWAGRGLLGCQIVPYV